MHELENMFRLARCSSVVSHLSIRMPSAFTSSSIQQYDNLRMLRWRGLRRCICTSVPRPSKDVDKSTPATVIYRGPLAGQMKRLKLFSFFTSAFGFYVAPTVIAEMSKAGMGVAVVMGSVMGLFTLVTPLMIHMVVRNYVTEIKHDAVADKYIAATISLMMRTRTVTFSADEVLVPSVPGMFTTFMANGRPLFADGAKFEPVEHFGRLMGYNRPLDLGLSKTARPDTAEQAAPPSPPPPAEPPKR